MRKGKKAKDQTSGARGLTTLEAREENLSAVFGKQPKQWKTEDTSCVYEKETVMITVRLTKCEWEIQNYKLHSRSINTKLYYWDAFYIYVLFEFVFLIFSYKKIHILRHEREPFGISTRYELYTLDPTSSLSSCHCKIYFICFQYSSFVSHHFS